MAYCDFVTAKVELSKPTKIAVWIDGAKKELLAYNVNGSNYVAIRDLSFITNGTAGKFSVDYKDGTTMLTLGSSSENNSLSRDFNRGYSLHQISAPISSTFNSFSTTLNGFNDETYVGNSPIGGNNFFLLRDLCRLVNIGVEYRPGDGSIILHSGRIEPLNDTEIIYSYAHSNEYSFRLSFWAAMMEQDHYNNNLGNTTVNGFVKVATHNVGSDSYSIGYRDVKGLGAICLINARGTDATSVKDWGSNLSLKSVEFPRGATAEANKGTIHLGFRDSAEAIYSDIVRRGYLSNYSNGGAPDKLYYFIIGHSRGGAIAEVLSLLIPRETGVNDSHILSYTHATAPYAYAPLRALTSAQLRGHMYKTINDLDPLDDIFGKMPDARTMTVANTIVVIPENGIAPYVNEKKGTMDYDSGAVIYYHMLESDYIPWLYNRIVGDNVYWVYGGREY